MRGRLYQQYRRDFIFQGSPRKGLHRGQPSCYRENHPPSNEAKGTGSPTVSIENISKIFARGSAPAPASADRRNRNRAGYGRERKGIIAAIMHRYAGLQRCVYGCDEVAELIDESRKSPARVV